MKSKKLKDVKLPLGSSVTANLHGRKPEPRDAATRGVRAVVASWQGRTLRVQNDSDLLAAHRVLAPHEATLYEHSPHAPRLLANLTTELTSRHLLPCSTSAH